MLALGEQEDLRFWDEHSFGKQRFYNILCVLFGADPEANKHLVPGYLPVARAARCPEEFRRKKKGWTLMLEQHGGKAKL